MYSACEYDSPTGKLMLVAEDDHLTQIVLPGDTPVNCDSGESQVLTDTCRWLDAYFDGKKPDPARIPLRMYGTAFQREVWKILQKIPYGMTRTYGEIAEEISPGMSAQAVGNAVGRNPLPIIVPCHRVLGKDGRLTGYRGGLEMKKYLLKTEGITCWK